MRLNCNPALHAVERCSQEAGHVPTVDELIRRLAGGVVSAGEHDYFVVKMMARELGYGVAGEFG